MRIGTLYLPGPHAVFCHDLLWRRSTMLFNLYIFALRRYRMREKHCLRSGRRDGESDAHVPQCSWLGAQVSGMRKMFLVRMPFLPVFLLLIAACLPIASNGFYCGSISLVLPGSLEECLSDKRLDTLALLPQYRCRGTSVPDKTGRHFYVSANLSFLMDEFLSCLPKKFPSCLHNCYLEPTQYT